MVEERGEEEDEDFDPGMYGVGDEEGGIWPDVARSNV